MTNKGLFEGIRKMTDKHVAKLYKERLQKMSYCELDKEFDRVYWNMWGDLKEDIKERNVSPRGLRRQVELYRIKVMVMKTHSRALRDAKQEVRNAHMHALPLDFLRGRVGDVDKMESEVHALCGAQV